MVATAPAWLMELWKKLARVRLMEITMSEHVKSEVADGVMTLTLHRPEKRTRSAERCMTHCRMRFAKRS